MDTMKNITNNNKSLLEMTDSAHELQSSLARFYGTEQYHYSKPFEHIKYTDGVKYIARKAGAYWLLDIIKSVCTLEEHVKKHLLHDNFVCIHLIVYADKSAKVEFSDGDNREIYTQHVESTDFPLPAIKLYFVDNVIMLPSEY